ncbi:MAG: type IV secretory system conjugative DNA transfer family protein [Lachnospiraceae bacterium]|nr:type IV secretory system conjugative DNA transfer family protein [Lachnospiraceae bacterium]
MDEKEMQYRILAKEVKIINDTWVSRINNNDLIVGASGCGKTTGYVIPNIEQCNESMIVADTKGMLHRKLGNKLKKKGYKVYVLDFIHPEKSCAYNPLDYIDGNRKTGRYREQDIITISQAMLPTRNLRDTFWEDSARMVLSSLIAFAMEALPKEEQNMTSVAELFKLIGSKEGRRIFEEFEAESPDSFAVKKYKSYCNVFSADKTWGCISQFLSDALELYDFQEIKCMYEAKSRFHIKDLGRKKIVLFVNVSDTDRAFDRLINVFYTQAIQQLCKEADKNPDGRLKVPVRIILDDFATNVYIPDFDKIISVIRSREISVSLILQSLSQLETMYTPAQAKTIINGCDHLLYLGGQDVQTADYISIKANQPIDKILNMGLSDAYLFTRGEMPKRVEKINPFGKETDYERQ